MKKRYYVILSIVLIGIIGCIFNIYNHSFKRITKSNDDLINTKNDSLAIMLQGEDGNYTVSDDNNWPTREDGYIFNDTLSKCENGGQVVWDEESNSVIITATSSDKCYIYFDKYVEPLQIISAEISDGNTESWGIKNITVNVTGGTGNYTYSYQDNRKPLCGGKIDGDIVSNGSNSNLVIDFSKYSMCDTHELIIIVEDRAGNKAETVLNFYPPSGGTCSGPC